MTSSNPGGPATRSDAERLVDLGDDVARRFGIACGQINLRRNDGSAVGVDLVLKTHFGLGKRGGTAARQISPRILAAPSAIEIDCVRDEFNRCLSTLIYKYGSIVIEIQDSRVHRVILQASMLRGELDTLGSFFVSRDRDVA